MLNGLYCNFLNGIFGNMKERHKTFLQEIQGCLSGVKFYLLQVQANKD